jgi:molecular chaperone GrpE
MRSKQEPREEKKEIEAPEDKELLDDPKKLLLECESEREEYLNGWKRAKADLINYQREEANRVERINQRTRENFIYDLLPVLESFELGLETTDKKNKSYEGLRLVRLQLSDVLKRQGVEEIRVSLGDDFDPALHESVGEIESDTPAGKIAEEVRKGYTMGEKTIKATQVRLSRGG